MREVVERSAEDQSVEWYALLFFAIARTYRGEFDQARELTERSKRITAELGLLVNNACTSLQLTFIELSAGDLVNAERELRRAPRRAPPDGCRESTSFRLGEPRARPESTWGSHEVFRTSTTPSGCRRTTSNHSFWPERHARGRSRPLGASERRRMSSRATLALWEGSDNVFLGSQALAALAHVLQLRGKFEEARATHARELAMHERKRDLPGAARARRALAAL